MTPHDIMDVCTEIRTVLQVIHRLLSQAYYTTMNIHCDNLLRKQYTESNRNCRKNRRTGAMFGQNLDGFLSTQKDYSVEILILNFKMCSASGIGYLGSQHTL